MLQKIIDSSSLKVTLVLLVFAHALLTVLDLHERDEDGVVMSQPSLDWWLPSSVCMLMLSAARCVYVWISGSDWRRDGEEVLGYAGVGCCRLRSNCVCLARIEHIVSA